MAPLARGWDTYDKGDFYGYVVPPGEVLENGDVLNVPHHLKDTERCLGGGGGACVRVFVGGPF